ncbi:MAG: helix-turn-helix domain-containing protein [Pseudomonadota bacterium]
MTDLTRLSARDALIEAAFAIFSRDPSASLSEVADKAGVGRATLHRHFKGRDDLIIALAKTAIAEMDAAAEAACEAALSETDALRRCFDALIPLGDRQGFLAREAIENHPDIKTEYARQLRETEEMVEAAKAEGAFDPAIPNTWIVQAYDSLLYAAWESVSAGALTHAQASELAWRTLTSGLSARLKGDD